LSTAINNVEANAEAAASVVKFTRDVAPQDFIACENKGRRL
jgi:hypothetical protein